MADPGAVKVAIHRLRKRFRECIRSEIAETLAAGDDIKAGLSHLIEVLVLESNPPRKTFL